MKKLFILLITLTMFSFSRAQKAPAPDFAFPKQATKQAEKDLTAALASGDGQATVDALIRYGIAQIAIDEANFPDVIAKVEQVAKDEKSAVTRSLLNLLTGDLYKAYYDQNSYNLDQRTTVADGGSDTTLWSGQQLQERVRELYVAALSTPNELKAARLADYSKILTGDKTTAIFYPTLFDFASVHALTNWPESEAAGLLPLGRLFIFGNYAVPQVMGESGRQLMAIGNDWVEAHKEPSAARVEAILQRQAALRDYVAEPEYGDDDEEMFDNLMKLYEAEKSTPYAVEFLLEASDYVNPDMDLKKRLYPMLKAFAKAHPGYLRAAAVDNAIKSLTKKELNAMVPEQVGKGRAFEVAISVDNVNKGEILIYRVPDLFNKNYVEPKDLRSFKIVGRYGFTIEGEAPFAGKATIEAVVNDYGRYVVAPTFDGMGIDRYVRMTSCSDLAIVDLAHAKDLDVWTVDLQSGAPVAGATVNVKYGEYRSKKTVKSTTDKDGQAMFKGLSNDAQVNAVKGDDRFGATIGNWFNDARDRRNRAATVKTSLPLYHQGDTADFVIIAYDYDNDKHQLVKGEGVRAILRDANFQAVDTLELTTDDFGRASGRFTLPKEGLTGNFHIQAQIGGYYVGSGMFMVSDYKLPTYTVKIETETDSASNAVTIKGKAETYSGFPVGEAKVVVELRGLLSHYWWSTPSPVFLRKEATTGADGEFAIALTDEDLSLSPYPGKTFSMDATVTSASGENQTASGSFSLGKGVAIQSAIPTAVEADECKSLQIRVVDLLGHLIDAPVTIKFENKATGHMDVVETRSINGQCEVDLSKLQSGQYSLTFSSEGADDEVDNLIIYRPDDSRSPSDKPLWIPKMIYTVNAGKREAEILYAAKSDDVNVLLIVTSKENVMERRWLKSHEGMNKLKIAIPDSAGMVRANFYNISDGKAMTDYVTIKVEDPSKELKVKIETFRDKITPESEETITLSVTNGDGQPQSAAVILDMYSKAIDALAKSSWTFAPMSDYQSWAHINESIHDNRMYLSVSGILDYLKAPQIEMPRFNLYDRGFRQMRIRGTRFYKMNAAPAVEEAVADEAEAEPLMLEETVVTAYGVRKASATGSVEMEAVDDLSNEKGAGGEDEGAEPKKEVGYRPSEVPLAFFRPNLTTDADGRLTYSFTVPNANTTWVFNALAFNADVETATATREAVASKPVMVSPNMPRFMRRGDKATILASVMNNSDAAVAITTTFEVVNPADMSVIASKTSADSIEPMTAKIADFEVEALRGYDALIVRVKSTTDKYGDGEQTLLPILADSQRVIDSETFYMAPDVKQFATTLPAGKAESSTVVSFCENPAWEVVSALPGLRTGDSTSSLAACADLFSAAVASGILKSNPAIEPALKQWLDGAKDNTALLSMLNKNDDLKQLMLASTPWVAEAESDVERMTRLALLFDDKQIKSAVDKSIATLTDLERGKGGWAWTSYGEKPSEWVTLQILYQLGHLKSLGYLPSNRDLDKMIGRALKYVDKEVADDFARYPKSTYFEYVFVRGLYTETDRSLGARKATTATVNSIVKNWKSYRPAMKAAAAIILNRGEYPTLAKTLIASLREFAKSTPEQGMWWPSVDESSWWSLTANAQTSLILDAFHLIEPTSADIDKIRQWLILNKQVQDWGNSVNTSAVIASILGCGSNWLNKPGDVNISIDDKTLKPTEADLLTGKFVMEVDQPGGRLEIERANDGPAWGAVINRYEGAMTEIEAHGLAELSIEKATLARRDGQWVATEKLNVGDVAKVVLTIKATRDMDYVAIVDQRAACLEPVVQLPRPVFCDGLYFYLENRDARTNLFIDRLPAGQYVVEYEMNVNNAGVFSSGVATVQSQYTPEMTAHSAGTQFEVAR